MAINQTDLKLRLLSKKPIFVDNIPIYPLSFDTISEIGYSKYNKLITLLCLDKEEFLPLFNEFDVNEFETFDYFITIMSNNENFLNSIIEILSQICHCDVIFCLENASFQINNKLLNHDNFDEFQEVVKCRNSINKIKEDVDNPSNEKARQILEKRKKLRQKQQENPVELNDITIDDLITTLAGGMNLPLEVVMGYDMYQFNNMFNRLSVFKEYDVNIQAILHGANSNDIELKHWIRKNKCLL